ncbi:MAG TPA: hypothetical protein PKE30_03540 [Niabella sp.]|nr:hypothetical protein [Niabella sp.]
MKFLLALFFTGCVTLNAQHTTGKTTGSPESGFIALTAFKTLVENKLVLFNDILQQGNGSPKWYRTYLEVQNEYGKMDLAYAVFKERLINCIRYNDNKNKALNCISSNAINIDSLSKGFLSKIDAAMNGNVNENTTAGSAKLKSATLTPLTAKAAIDMVDYVFSFIAKARDNRRKQLDILQDEILSDRYKLKSFGSIVKYRTGNGR